MYIILFTALENHHSSGYFISSVVKWTVEILCCFVVFCFGASCFGDKLAPLKWMGSLSPGPVPNITAWLCYVCIWNSNEMRSWCVKTTWLWFVVERLRLTLRFHRSSRRAFEDSREETVSRFLGLVSPPLSVLQRFRLMVQMCAVHLTFTLGTFKEACDVDGLTTPWRASGHFHSY